MPRGSVDDYWSFLAKIEFSQQQAEGVGAIDPSIILHCDSKDNYYDSGMTFASSFDEQSIALFNVNQEYHFEGVKFNHVIQGSTSEELEMNNLYMKLLPPTTPTIFY